MLCVSSGSLKGNVHGYVQCGTRTVLGKLLGLKYVETFKFWAKLGGPGDSSSARDVRVTMN